MSNIKIIRPEDGNRKAASFNLGADFMRGFQTISIPKNDELLKAVPVAYHCMSKIDPTPYRIDLVHDAVREATVLSINFLLRDPKFVWPDSDLKAMKGVLGDFFSVNGQAVDLDAMKKVASMEPFIPDGDDECLLVDAFNDKVGERVRLHGGSYTLTGMEAEAEKTGGLFSRKVTGRELVTAFIAPSGACNSCGLFEITFGEKTVESVNDSLDSRNSPFRLKEIKKDPKMGARGALVLKR